MSPRAVLVVLDGLPHRHVSPALTPTLVGLARQGGHAADGGIATLTSATYPNHATLVTGTHPGRHGLTANFVAKDGAVRSAADIGPGAPTLFDVTPSSAAVFGDQHLVGVTGARRAGSHWPVDGVVPPHAVMTSDGYVADETTTPVLISVLGSDAELVVAQLNDPDTAGHAFGPDSDEAAAVYHRTDATLGRIVEALETRWEETFLAVVSDHDQVQVSNPACVDLWSLSRAAGLDLVVIPEGECAVVSGPDPTDGTWLDDVDGVAGHDAWHHGTRLVWAEPGRVIGWGECTMRGIHGGPGSTTQVAVVAGGHPLVAEAAAVLAVRRPRAEDWAPTLAAVLGVDLPAATGRSLVGR